MDTSQKYCLIVAQELNMTKAAQKCFVSHQTISQHIHQIEERYGVMLFYRTPRLALTEEGKQVFESLMLIENIEKNLKSYISKDSGEIKGQIRLGVPDSRHDIIIPNLLPPFKLRYPNIQFEVTSDFTENLEEMTQNGLIDFFIGIGLLHSKSLTSVRLREESFYLIISKEMLKQYYPGEEKTVIDKWRDGISIAEIERIPLILNPPTSRLRKRIEEIANMNRLRLNIAFESNKNGVFADLCRANYGAYIASDIFLPSIIKSYHAAEKNPLYCFPVKCLNNHAFSNDVFMAYHYRREFLPYQKDFMSMTINYFNKMDPSVVLLDEANHKS